MEVYVCRALILAHAFPLTTCSSFYIFLGQFSISRNLCTSPIKLALAKRVLTSSIGVRVRRLFGFVLGGAVVHGAV